MLIAYPGSTDNSATIGSIKAIVFLLLSLYEADICPIVLHSTRLVTGQRSPLGQHSSITKILPIPPGRGDISFLQQQWFLFFGCTSYNTWNPDDGTDLLLWLLTTRYVRSPT